MKSRNNLPDLLVAGTIIMILKIHYQTLTLEELHFILVPVNKIVEWSFGISSVLNPDGFYFESFNIVINKSCSGFNFWVISFMTCVYLILNNIKHISLRWLTIPFSIVFSYFITIVANASRIIISMLLKNIEGLHWHWVHEATGIFIYMMVLIIIYSTGQFLLQKTSIHYAKSI